VLLSLREIIASEDAQMVNKSENEFSFCFVLDRFNYTTYDIENKSQTSEAAKDRKQQEAS